MFYCVLCILMVIWKC